MKRLVIALLALTLLLGACASRAPASPTAAPTPTPVPKAAYVRIIQDREDTYGKGSFVESMGGYLPCGVACVALQDLNGDGLMELLLWENTLSEDDQGTALPNLARIEVWTYDNITGEAVNLYDGDPLVGGDPGAQYLSIVKLDGQWMLLTGEAGGAIDVAYRAMRYGKFEIVHTARDEFDTGEPVLYVDGEPSDEETFAAMEQNRRDLCNSYYGDEEAVRQLLNTTARTRQSLGF